VVPLLQNVEFLPDGMVIEGEWQQERELARQIETWRAGLGQALSSELFLQHARYALFLRRWVKRDGVRHVHAMGARELLTGWILRRLCGVTLSATLDEHSSSFADSVLERIARDCVGLRIAATAPAWTSRLEQTPSGPVLMPIKPKRGQALEPEWLGKLNEWGGL
jgi:hypothetical protein